MLFREKSVFAEGLLIFSEIRAKVFQCMIMPENACGIRFST